MTIKQLMSSDSCSVGWVINVKEQEIKVLQKDRKIRLPRNCRLPRPIIVSGDWIAYRKNTVSGQGCLIQVINPVLPSKTFWASSKLGNGSPQTKCICVKTIAINSPDVQLHERDCGIYRIWSPHFEYLADPLHLFDDPVNVKPNVAYDVWCRLNCDPKSQCDGTSPILEIYSIEAPSENQMISLSSPWVRNRESNPINQVNQPLQNQQFTAQSQEPSAETQNQSSESQKMIKEEQLRPTASKVKVELAGSTKQLAEVQHETECNDDTTLDLIAQLLCERLKMVQSHRKECQGAIELLNKASMVALMRHQRKQQTDGRERHTKMVSEFVANRPKGCFKSRCTYEETLRILRKLRSELRSYLAFYLSSIYACNENETEEEKEQVRKELGMNEKEFDENVVLSKEILSVLDAYSPDAQSSQKTHIEKFPAENPELKYKQSSLMNPGSPTEKKPSSDSNEPNNVMQSSNLRQSGSGGSEEPMSAIEFGVDQFRDKLDPCLKHLREAYATKLAWLEERLRCTIQ